MLFLTYWFVCYMAAFFAAYWLVRLPALRMGVLLVGSAIFHTHFAGPAGVLPIVALSLYVYLAGLSRHRLACWLGVALSVLLLVFYKYTRFLVLEILGVIAPDWQALWAVEPPALLSVVPPLAISFFVFEFVHYLVDVARGDEPIRNPLDFAVYTIFWPSIVAGPVKRYQEFLPSLYAGLNQVDAAQVAYGCCRVALGLVKKFTADTLTAWLLHHEGHFSQLDMGGRWLFLVAVALRILFDFSGYSDMAIGFARMHGIRLPENFRWPYLSTSIGDFWRRWHISLSSWIRDYIYIALGGSHGGLARKISNGLAAFALCGLWHGAGWNFLFWGVYHGLGLAIASSYQKLLGSWGTPIGRLLEWRPLSWSLTMLFVGVGWLFFFYPLPKAMAMVAALIGAQ